MRSTRGFAVLSVPVLLGVLATAAPAVAEPADPPVQVGIVDEHGAPVFCTRNAAGRRAQPEAAGGYRITGLRPGKWTISLDLPHERVDVLISADEGETVVVPPVVARGRCRSIAVSRPLDLRRLTDDIHASWAVRFDRTYDHRVGIIAAGFRRHVPTRRSR